MPEIADQRLGHPSLTCGNVGDSPPPGNNTPETGLAGCPERIRTWKCNVELSHSPTSAMKKGFSIAFGVFWFSLAVTEHASASHGFGVSATRYCCAEDVLVVAIVVAPFKLSNVQRQIFAADFMIAAHNTALSKSIQPKTIRI